MRQDRSTAIAGTLGAGPALVPVKLTLQSDRGAGADLHLRDREGPALHAAPDLRVDRQHAAGLRARVRRRHLPGPRHGAGPRPRRGRASTTSSPATRRRSAPRPRCPARCRCCCATSASRCRSTASSWPSSRSRSRAPRASSACGSARASRGPARRCRSTSSRARIAARSAPTRSRSGFPAGSSGALSLIVSDGTRLAFSEQREQRPPSHQRQRAAADPRLQRGAAQQPHLRQADARHVRRHRRRRARAGAAAVGPRGDRGRAARRRRAAALVGRRRRVGRARPTTAITGQRTLPVVVRPLLISMSNSGFSSTAAAADRSLRPAGAGRRGAAAPSRRRAPASGSSRPRPTSSRATPTRVSIDTDGRVTIAPGAAAARRRRHAGGLADRRRRAARSGPPPVTTASCGASRRRARRRCCSTPPELDLQAIAAGPQGIGARRLVAGRQGLSRRRRRHRRRRSSIPTTSTSGRSRWPPDGTTYVGTGAKGKVYKVPAAGGAGTLFYDTGTEHVSALAFDASGKLLVGTSTPGRVVRLDADGKPFVLLEAGYQEVRSLRVAGGVTYATAAGASRPARRRPHARPRRRHHARRSRCRPRSRSPPCGDRPVVTAGAGAGGAESRASGAAEGRHLPHRRRRRLDDGVGVARRRALRRARRAGRQPARRHRRQGQALSARRRSGAGHARHARRRAADHRARRRRRRRHPPRGVEPGPAAAPVVEAGADRAPTSRTSATRRRVATWGTIRWQATMPAGTTVALHTRSGNTRTPDATWSPWSGRYTAALGHAHREPEGALPAVEGGADRRQRREPGAHVGVRRLPAAQHAPDRRQRDGAPAGRGLPAAVPHRRSRAGRHRRPPRPRVRPSPGTPSVGQTLGRRTFQKSLQTFVWSARDTDGDRLQYTLAYRREGDRTWTVLKDGLDDDVFTWDTTTVPDGTYVVKVTASDATANAPTLALQGERESQSFEVDNTSPVVTVTPARGRARRRRSASRCATDTRRSSASSTRSRPIAGDRPTRSTGCWIHGKSASS